MSDVKPRDDPPAPPGGEPPRPWSHLKRFGVVGAVFGVLWGIVTVVPKNPGDPAYLLGVITGGILGGGLIGLVIGFITDHDAR